MKKKNTVLNKKFIDFLKKNYLKYKEDIRINLHNKRSDRHHDMIILQQKKNYYLPHKHIKKGETYHIIKGRMACILLKSNGKIKFSCILKKNDIFRTPVNTFHTMMPITNYVIYHESKVGTYLKKNDSIFLLAKKFENNKKKILKFKNEVKRRIHES